MERRSFLADALMLLSGRSTPLVNPMHGIKTHPAIKNISSRRYLCMSRRGFGSKAFTLLRGINSSFYVLLIDTLSDFLCALKKNALEVGISHEIDIRSK
jgi:hypothetical protein